MTTAGGKHRLIVVRDGKIDIGASLENARAREANLMVRLHPSTIDQGEKAMTPTERKRREREARQSAGLVRLEVYVRPEIRDKVRAYAEKMNKAAERASGPPSPSG